MPSLQFDNASLKKGFRYLKMLDNKSRIELLKTIHWKESITVTELYASLKVEQSIVSQHLSILREAHFVSTQKEGKYVYYTINYIKLEEIMGMIGRVVGEPKNATLTKPIKLSISEYRAYVIKIMNDFEPIPQVLTYKGMCAWLKNFSQMLKAYNAATQKRKRELLQEAEDIDETDLKKLRTELEKIRTNAIQAFIKKYKF